MKKNFEIDILSQKSKKDIITQKTIKATIQDDLLNFENYRFLQFKRNGIKSDFDFIYKNIRSVLNKKEHPFIIDIRISEV